MGPEILLSDDLVGPLNEAHEYRWSGDGRVLAGEIGVEDPTGPDAGASNVNPDFVVDDGGQRFGEWRPSDRDHRVGDRGAHQCHSLTEQKDLDVDASGRESVGMMERERGFCWIGRSPRALDQGLCASASAAPLLSS